MNFKGETDSVLSREKKETQNKEKSYKVFREVQLDKSYHKVRDSLLTSTSFHSLNNRGISSIFFAVLVTSNICLAIESFAKYGFFVNPVRWLKIYFSTLTKMPSVLIFSGLGIFPLSSLVLEILLSKGILNDQLGLILTIFLLTFEILIPPFVVHFINNYIVAFTVVMCYIAVFLKLISYHMVNYWYRQNISSNSQTRPQSISTEQSKHKDFTNEDKVDNLIQYPHNLNLKDIYYFVFAPTLSYELNFPLFPHIRKGFLIKRILELICLLLLIISFLQQLMFPFILDGLENFQNMDYITISEIYFKLCIPVFTVWIIFFYTLFHTWLNIVGEVLRFGDRFFYDEWWNVEDMADWWRKWNIPVHKWCLRHMYKPLLQAGYTKAQSILTVFFVSGIFHEVYSGLGK